MTRPGASRGRQEVVDGLLEALHRVRDVLAAGTPEERKALVRNFLAGIQVEKATRQAILRWYRLPRDLSLKLVELRGIEPLTLRLPGPPPAPKSSKVKDSRAADRGKARHPPQPRRNRKGRAVSP